MPNGIILLISGGIEKSVDGKGGIQRGTFVTSTGETYQNATLVSGNVYASDGSYVGPVSGGTWNDA